MTGPDDQLSTVLGFVFEGLPGLDDYYLPAMPGLTVLYGLNGAGKTRVLQGIERAYRGVQGGAQLLVRVPDPDARPADWKPEFEDDQWLPAHHVQGEIKAELCLAWNSDFLTSDQWPQLEEYYVSDHVFERVYRDAVGVFLNPEEHDHVDPFVGALDSGRIGRMRREMLRQRLILVTPTGSDDVPSWTVSPAAMEGEDYPALTDELRRMLRIELWWDAGGDPDEVLYPDHGEPSNGMAFTFAGRTTPLIGAARGSYFGQGPQFVLPKLAPEPLAFEDEDPEGQTRESLLRDTLPGYGVTARAFDGLVSDDPVRPLEIPSKGWGRTFLALVEHRANNLYAKVLMDAPELKLAVLPLSQWWAGRPIRWTFGPADLNLEVMSSAEARWARWAIAHAIHQTALRTGDTPVLTLIDEPERALHRSAEAYMAEHLHRLAAEEGRQVIASTHSPELLNLPDVRLLEVRRDGGGTTIVSTFTAENREELEALGLLPSDLLRRQRGFVMVEGEHDQRLLEHWIGPELRAMRLSILNLRGASKLPRTIESQVLFDFTGAHLFVILDNLRAKDLQETWDQVLRLKKKGSDEDALTYLLENIEDTSKEGEWIRQWLSKALEKEREARLTPFSIEVPDIIDLLDVAALVPGATSWSELRAEHEEVPRSGHTKDFKTWLRKTKRARFDTSSLLEAAPSTPPEVIRAFVRRAASVLENQPRIAPGSPDFNVLLEGNSRTG